MAAPRFDLDFDPAYGEAVPVAPGVRRLTVRNPGPFTFHGTNTYLLGARELAVIDPGPADEAHLEAILRAVGGVPVTHVLVTHTHADHSPLAAELAARTGARILAEGRHRPSRPLREGEVNLLDAAGDRAFAPDALLADGERITIDGRVVEAVATPGHTANHLAFALPEEGLLFSGDHVMAWATSIVAPPDGAMADYMASLDRLLARDDRLYLPGHGGPVTKPREFVRALRTHRRMRESSILARLATGDRTVPELVAALYREVDPRLHGAAGLSVLAHLEDLVEGGRAVCDGPVRLEGRFAPA